MNPSLKNISKGWIGLLWCSCILILYYVSHKPISPESLSILVREPLWTLAGLFGLCVLAVSPIWIGWLARHPGWLAVPGLGAIALIAANLASRAGWIPESPWTVTGNSLFVFLTATALVSVAGAIGILLVGSLPMGPLVSLSLQAALGLGLMGLGVLAFGSSLGLSITGLWGILGTSLALLWKPIRKWWEQWAELGVVWNDSGNFERWAGAMVTSLFGLALLIALAPPAKFDSLMYHLVMPNAYLQQGGVSILPWLVQTGLPQTAEMLYTWAIGLAGNSAATVLSWMFAVLAVTGLFGMIQRRLGLRPAFAATAALLCGYSLAVSPAWGYVDWLTLYFGTSALASFFAWQESRRPIALVLGAIFAGMALGTKYQAGLLGLVLFFLLVWDVWRRRARLLPVLWLYALYAGLTALPWLLRNLFYTGNPLYPFLFPTGVMNSLRLSMYQGASTWGNWSDFFLLPLRATTLGIESSGGYDASIGPLLLGLGALAWIGQKQRSPEQRLTVNSAALVAGMGILVWAIGNQLNGFFIQTRFYYVFFPAFAILTAAGFQCLSQIRLPQVRIERLLAALVLLPLSLNVVECALHALDSGAPATVLGLKSSQDYLSGLLGWYIPATQDVLRLPPGSKTMLLYDSRSLYCLPKCTPDETLDRWQRSKFANQNPEAILAAWKKEGFSHILFYREGARFMAESGDRNLSRADFQEMVQFLGGLPAPVSYEGIYELYTIPR